MTLRHRALNVDELRMELEKFEYEYGCASEFRHEPFKSDGVLVETADWRRWDAVYGMWRRMTAPRTPFAAG